MMSYFLLLLKRSHFVRYDQTVVRDVIYDVTMDVVMVFSDVLRFFYFP